MIPNIFAQKSLLLKDDYLVPPKEDDYMSVRHLVLEGTNEEIGFKLAEIAQSDYQTQLSKYADMCHSRTRMEYFRRNWPEMEKRVIGVAKAFGLDPYDTIYDASDLPYDNYGIGCSAVFFPPSLTLDEHPMLVRNYDWYILTPSEWMHHTPQLGEHRFSDRSFVMAVKPTDGGYATLSVGCNNLLNPFLDVMNEKGLFIAALADPEAPASRSAGFTGGCMTGLSICQLPQMLATKCATVAEAKKELLVQRFSVAPLGFHWLIADAAGNATIFEVNPTTCNYIFIDGKPGEPLILTNYHIFEYPSYDTFPEIDLAKENNPFVRRYILDEMLSRQTGKFSKADAVKVIDTVLCAFVDDAKAGVPGRLPQRTLWRYVANLAEKDMELVFYLGDKDPIENTNHMEIRRTLPLKVGFETMENK